MKQLLIRFPIWTLVIVAAALTYLVVEFIFLFNIDPNPSKDAVEIKEYARAHPEFSIAKHMWRTMWELKDKPAAEFIIVAIVFALISFRDEVRSIGADGRTLLRIQAGLRWLLNLLLVVFIVFFAFQILTGAQLVLGGVITAFVLTALLVSTIYWCHIVSIRFDDTLLLYRNWTGKTAKYDLGELEQYKSGMACYVLRFKRGRKLSVSDSFVGLELLIESLDRAIERNKNA